jgi:hypothetical protein
VVNDWGRCLEKKGSAFYDAATLPHPKADIEACVLAAWRLSTDETMRKHLSVSLITLADYQQGVGSEPISLVGPTTAFDDAGGSDKEAVARPRSVAADCERYGARLAALAELARKERERYRLALQTVTNNQQLP